ncbi:hypothetical protein GF342_00205 [Candidatus Woesearchaeota archaeon]|nr:hypothetical protein [Candidatus Woesearchaeota archaeon]
MAIVEITKTLYEQIDRKFKGKSVKVLQHLKSLEESPKKGKLLGTIGGIVIKEVKYEGFRFYFITDGFKLKYTSSEDLTDLLLRVVRMSDKKHQQQTIDEIKQILLTIGVEGLT